MGQRRVLSSTAGAGRLPLGSLGPPSLPWPKSLILLSFSSDGSRAPLPLGWGHGSVAERRTSTTSRQAAVTPTYQCNQCVAVGAALGLDILLPAHCFLFLKKKETSLHAIGLLGPDVRQLGELGLWSGPLDRYGDRGCDWIAGIVEMLVRD